MIIYVQEAKLIQLEAYKMRLQAEQSNEDF